MTSDIRSDIETITVNDARRVLRYDESSGLLFWAVSLSNRCKAGSEAGFTHDQGRSVYRKVTILGRTYLVHRVIMLMVNGEWPPEHVDHIDGNGLNNRLSNLRLATNKENGRNQAIHKTNTSGHTGVVWHSDRQMWMAQIFADGVRHYLGYFAEIEDAIAERKSAEVRFRFHMNHGRKPTKKSELTKS